VYNKKAIGVKLFGKYYSVKYVARHSNKKAIGEKLGAKYLPP